MKKKSILKILLIVIIVLSIFNRVEYAYTSWDDMYNADENELEAELSEKSTYINHYNILKKVNYNSLSDSEKKWYKYCCNFLASKMKGEGSTYATQVSELENMAKGNSGSGSTGGSGSAGGSGSTGGSDSNGGSSSASLDRLYLKIATAKSWGKNYIKNISMAELAEYINAYTDTNVKDVDSSYLNDYIDLLLNMTQNPHLSENGNQAYIDKLKAEVNELRNSGINLTRDQINQIEEAMNNLEEAKKQSEISEKADNFDEADREDGDPESRPSTGTLGSSDASASHTLGEITSEAKGFLKKGIIAIPFSQANLKEASDTLFNILLGLGMATAVIVGVYLGVKFMMSTVEDKAKVKEAIIPYIAGCVVVFGAFTIWKLALILLENIG